MKIIWDGLINPGESYTKKVRTIQLQVVKLAELILSVGCISVSFHDHLSRFCWLRLID